MPPKDQRKIDPFILYGDRRRRRRRCEDSGWKPEDDEERERTGVLIGSGIGGLQGDRRGLDRSLHEKGPRRVSPVLHSRRR